MRKQQLIKRNLLTLSCILLSSLVSAKSIKTVKSLYEFSNPVDVTRIDYSKNATTVYFATNTDSAKVRISRHIYVVADDGKEYHAKSIKGIQFDSLYSATDKGLKFSVDFEPVNETNIALDVRNPGQFSIYGIHDANTPLVVPKVETAINPDEEKPEFYQGKDVEIEGVVNYENVKWIVCNYITPRPQEGEKETYRTIIDADGHFKLRFKTYEPRRLTLSLSSEIFKDVYIRPGDKLFVEFNNRNEGKEFSYKNMSGHQTYTKLVNAPGSLFFDFNSYINDVANKFADKSYGQLRTELMDAYATSLERTNYINWHYCLSPYEAKMNIDEINAWYILYMISADVRVKWEYLNATTEENRKKYGDLLNKMDYSYLKNLSPNDATSFSNNLLTSVANDMIKQLYPIENCFQRVPEGTPHRWLKVIELQQEELNKITGWKGKTLIMEMIIIGDIHYLSKIDGEEDYEEVRKMMSHPLTQEYFDIYYKSYKDYVEGRTTGI